MRNVRNKAKECAPAKHPFQEAIAWTEIFGRLVRESRTERSIPHGYGFYDEENQPWDELSGIKVGNRTISITLPKAIWWVRAIHWVNGLRIMHSVWEMMDSMLSEHILHD